MTATTNAKTAALEALIKAHAIELKLPTVRRRFRALAAEATREQQTPVAYLAALLEAEHHERAERREKRRLIDARFPAIKRLQDFVFDDNPNVPQATIAALAKGTWIDDLESVILVGDSGTGKTHLATALAVCACQQGRRVRFTTLAGLANELQEAQSRRELARVVGRYARTELVALDELGYLALPDGAAELVFQVLSERHERGSLIVTTNLPFGEWTKSSPTHASPRPSSTASPTARTSSTPAPSPGASATASPANTRPPPDDAPACPSPLHLIPTGSAPQRRARDTLRPPTARHSTPTSGNITPANQPTRDGATSGRRAGATASRRAQWSHFLIRCRFRSRRGLRPIASRTSRRCSSCFAMRRVVCIASTWPRRSVR
jgi:DNA replication protein DnaC